MKHFIFLLLLLPALVRAGEGGETIGWERCVEEAKKNQPDLRAAAAEVTQAEAAIGASRSDLLPQISGTMSAGRSKSTGEERSDSYSYGISGRQLLFDGFKTWYDLDQSEQDLIATRFDYDLTSASVRLDLRSAFIDLLKAQEMIRITEEIASRRKQQVDLVQLRYDAGREHRGSLLTARANLADARLDITRARRDLLIAQKKLHRAMGREEFTPLKAEGSLELAVLPSGDPEFKELVERHPSVLKQATETESARLGVKSAWAGFAPDIYGTGNISRSDSDWPPDEERWSLGVSLSIPLFEGMGRVAEISRADAALLEAEENERSERDDTGLSLAEAWVDFRDTADEVSVQLQFLEADEERAKISEAQYSTGFLSFDNWIIIEDNLVRTKKTYLESRADALREEAKWIYSKGGGLDYMGSGQ